MEEKLFPEGNNSEDIFCPSKNMKVGLDSCISCSKFDKTTSKCGLTKEEVEKAKRHWANEILTLDEKTYNIVYNEGFKYSELKKIRGDWQ